MAHLNPLSISDHIRQENLTSHFASSLLEHWPPPLFSLLSIPSLDPTSLWSHPPMMVAYANSPHPSRWRCASSLIYDERARSAGGILGLSDGGEELGGSRRSRLHVPSAIRSTVAVWAGASPSSSNTRVGCVKASDEACRYWDTLILSPSPLLVHLPSLLVKYPRRRSHVGSIWLK